MATGNTKLNIAWKTLKHKCHTFYQELKSTNTFETRGFVLETTNLKNKCKLKRDNCMLLKSISF